MITIGLLLGILVGLFVMIIRPRIGTFIIWPILFTYPHSWWKYHGFLPLNIGYDDLFCVTLFVLTFVRRNLLDGIPIRFGYAFWAITGFSLILTIANLSGSTEPDAYVFHIYLKEVLKGLVFWCLFYSILHNINDARDLKIQVTMFAVASMLGGLIVIGQYYFPYQFLAWSNPDLIERYGVSSGERATGAFLNSNGAAFVIGCSLVMVATAVKLQKAFWAKVLVYSEMAVLLIAIMLTRSRSGLLAVGTAFGLMALWGNSKRVAWTMILGGFCIAMLAGTIREQYWERFRAVQTATGGWSRNIEGRFATWQSYLKTATTKVYLLGQGQAQGIRRNGMESHNMYISLLTVYGIGGAIWGLVVWLLFMWYALGARNDPDPMVSAVAMGCIFSMAALMVYGLTADAITSNYSRYLLFYLVVLIDRIRHLRRERIREEEMEGVWEGPLDGRVPGATSEGLLRGAYGFLGAGGY